MKTVFTKVIKFFFLNRKNVKNVHKTGFFIKRSKEKEIFFTKRECKKICKTIS